MAQNHLLSASLFSELFQHNLVSPDGRIIANDQQLRDYSTFLIKQSKDRTANLYVERKNLVNDVEYLLRLEDRTEEENKLLEELINELDLEFDEEGLLSLKKPRKPPKLYLGPKEPKKSIFQRKIEAELKRVKTLKRDLKRLDEWLEQISHFRPMTDQEERNVDWKESSIKYRLRTSNRMCDMENARTKLIKKYYKDYDKTLRSVLHQKLPKEKYLTRLSSPIHGKEKGSKNKEDDRDAETKVQTDVTKSPTESKHKAKQEDLKSNEEESTKDKAAVEYEKGAGINDKKSLEDETSAEERDEVQSGTVREIVEDKNMEGNAKSEHETAATQERAEEKAVKTNDNTEKEDVLIKATDETNMLNDTDGKDRFTDYKNNYTSSNHVADTEQHDTDDENTAENIRNAVDTNSDIQEIKSTVDEDKATKAGTVPEITTQNNENKMPQASTDERYIDTQTHDIPIADDNSTETKTLRRDFNKDGTTGKQDNPGKMSETRIIGSVIDEDVVTQVQADAQKELSSVDEDTKDTNETPKT